MNAPLAPPHNRMRQPPLSRVATLAQEGVSLRLVGAQDLLQTWDQGIPSIHIYVAYDADRGNSDVPPNCKLVIHAQWASDEGGGRVDVDAPRGTCFTMGASTRSISLECEFVPIDSPPPAVLVRPADVTVAAVVGGQGTIGPKPTFTTPRYIVLHGATAPATPVLIPSMAVRGYIVTDGTAPKGDVNVWLLAGKAYAAPISVQNGADGWFEVGGASYYLLENIGAIDTRAMIIWELAI